MKIVESSPPSYLRVLSSEIVIIFRIAVGVVCFGLSSKMTQAEVFPHENCGVNSALVVLLRLNHTVNKEKLLSSLNVGDDLSKATSFLHLQKHLRNIIYTVILSKKHP